MASLVEQMTGVTISSPYFPNVTSLELFPQHPKPPKNNRVALLYGKNGSGKSTIAQGFREYRDLSEPRTVILEPRKNGFCISIPPSEKPNKIFIFDEEYISSRVKIKESGLDAIVLFGDQVILEEQINETQGLIDSKIIEITQCENDFNRFTTNSDVNCPDYWIAKIREKLREAGGWAETGSRIKRQRQNLSVTDLEIERIGNITPTKSCIECKDEFAQCYSQFSVADMATASLPTTVKMVTVVGDIGHNTKVLLERVVNKPQLTDREAQLLQLFGIAGATNARTFISNDRNGICDKCFQPIGEEYKNMVLGEIDCILNRDVEQFKGELEKMLLSEVQIATYESYRDLPSYASVIEYLEKYNKAVVLHNTLVQAKIDNPFEIVEYDETICIMTACDAANQALAALEVDRINFNRIVNERPAVINELLELNDFIAHYAIESMYTSLQKQLMAKQAAEERLKQSREQLSYFKSKMDQLDSQRKNYMIASEEINNSLEYIFFCKNRLSLEPGSDQVYHLRVNGKQVDPNKVSCGERNALALCYFFTEIVKDMDSKAIYSDELFLVIDDPISSFDLENRVGIISFLRWKFEQILSCCATTKILVMTHDISVMFDLEKAFQEISKFCEKISTNAEYCLFHLDDKRLSDFMYKRHNEYSHLLKKIYEYANSSIVDNDADLVIGNVMRRALEAFSSFSFKLGINEVSLDERVLHLLPDEETRMYYRNLMYRLVLNNESHYMENIQGDPQMSFFSHLSPSEKQRTAKDILCFIYRLNKAHVLSHLPEAESKLELWCLR